MNRIIVLGALVAASTAFAHTIRVDFDHATHFCSYKTYRWVESSGNQSSKPLFPNQMMEQRIAAFIEEALAARGLRRVTTGGDLLVSYRMIVSEVPQFVTFGDGPGGWDSGWGWGWGGWGSWGSGYSVTTFDPFYEGTLVIDMVDANRKTLVFEGTSTQSVSSRPRKNTEKLSEAVRRIMAKYPPQP
jgi:hypothetical protein